MSNPEPKIEVLLTPFEHELYKALLVVAACKADEEGGVTLGSYEMGVVRAAIAKAEGRS